MKDSYETLAEKRRESRLTIQRSRFLGFAFHVDTPEAAESIIEEHRTCLYYDATHVCYAYLLGPEGKIQRHDDNGEPSGTAGMPICNKIRSLQLSDILVIVVRYFGGVKLGTSGLIKAYGETAELALTGAPRKEIILTESLDLLFFPNLTGIVMNLINKSGAKIEAQGYENGQTKTRVRIRLSEKEKFCTSLGAIYGVEIKKNTTFAN